MIKLGGLLFVAEKNRERKNERERKEGRYLCHKLNITDRFVNGFKSFFDNFVCKNNTSSYLLAFFYYFPIIIPPVYTKKIFWLVFTDRCDENIFSQNNLP